MAVGSAVAVLAVLAVVTNSTGPMLEAFLVGFLEAMLEDMLETMLERCPLSLSLSSDLLSEFVKYVRRR